MIIHLWEQEKLLLKKYAEEYKKKTGDSYSWSRIMEMLREHYEEHLDETLKLIMDIKERELKEANAREEAEPKKN